MKQNFKFICCGNVDDGKSTLIGRILLDTNNVKKDQLDDAKKASLKNGSDKIELSMLLDGLLAEREQQITIDIAHRFFDYKNIRFHILDCPGHKQYTKNMAIAAAEADSAVVVIDVTKGIQAQTKKHIEICSQFLIKNMCICLTKCDLILNSNNIYDEKLINKRKNEINEFMSRYNINYSIITTSALTGYNIDKVLEQILIYAEKSYKEQSEIKYFISHIQTAKMHKGQRYYYGKNINDNEPQINSEYTVYPNKIPVTIVKNINHGCFQIAEDVDISSGDCISNHDVIVSNIIKHKSIWFDEKTDDMLLKHGTRTLHIVNYTDDTIELDNNIIFNNIEDVKQNGFGIFIDNITKKTIGCCIFSQNYDFPKEENIEAKIHVISDKNQELAEAKAIEFIKSFTKKPVILNYKELKNSIFKNTDNAYETVYKLADLIKNQGHNVIIIIKQTDITL